MMSLIDKASSDGASIPYSLRYYAKQLNKQISTFDSLDSIVMITPAV